MLNSLIATYQIKCSLFKSIHKRNYRQLNLYKTFYFKFYVNVGLYSIQYAKLPKTIILFTNSTGRQPIKKTVLSSIWTNVYFMDKRSPHNILLQWDYISFKLKGSAENVWHIARHKSLYILCVCTLSFSLYISRNKFGLTTIVWF